MPQTRPPEYAVEFDITYADGTTHDHRCVYLAGEAECMKFVSSLGRYSVASVQIWRSDNQWTDITFTTAAMHVATMIQL